MSFLRIVLVLGALALAALVVRATVTASFGDSFAMIAADPWGLVSLVDLYLGFAVAAVFIAQFESRGTATVWIVLLFVFGNVVAAIWLAYRTPTIAQRLNMRR